jgi:hypothetical protein
MKLLGILLALGLISFSIAIPQDPLDAIAEAQGDQPDLYVWYSDDDAGDGVDKPSYATGADEYAAEQDYESAGDESADLDKRAQFGRKFAPTGDKYKHDPSNTKRHQDAGDDDESLEKRSESPPSSQYSGQVSGWYGVGASGDGGAIAGHKQGGGSPGLISVGHSMPDHHKRQAGAWGHGNGKPRGGQAGQDGHTGKGGHGMVGQGETASHWSGQGAVDSGPPAWTGGSEGGWGGASGNSGDQEGGNGQLGGSAGAGASGRDDGSN